MSFLYERILQHVLYTYVMDVIGIQKTISYVFFLEKVRSGKTLLPIISYLQLKREKDERRRGLWDFGIKSRVS